jgi:hypothetical protein
VGLARCAVAYANVCLGDLFMAHLRIFLKDSFPSVSHSLVYDGFSGHQR